MALKFFRVKMIKKAASDFWQEKQVAAGDQLVALTLAVPSRLSAGRLSVLPRLLMH
jgi:hypothetical protein